MLLAPDDRWARFAALPGFGVSALDGLRGATVLVIGAGGLGSAVLPAIIAAGVGTVHLVDDDLVEESNLPRQSLHGVGDVGRPKVESALERLIPLSSGVVVGHRERFDEITGPRLMDGVDLVVDGSDNFATRYLVDDLARERGLPVVWGAVSQYGGQVGVSWEGRGPVYRDLFPEAPPAGTVLSCAEGGILPSVCTVAGGLMAAQVLAILTRTTEVLLGRVTSYDARTARLREIPFVADPAAPWRTGAAHISPTEGPDEPMTDEPTINEPMTDAANTDAWRSADAIDARTLKDLLDAGTALQLVDVREAWEVQTATITGAHPLPMSTATPDDLDDLDRDVPLVVYCHHGVRSERMLAALRGAGFEGTHLAGGIDEWSREIDPSVPRY